MGRDLAQRTQQRVAERTDNAPAEREKSIYDDVRDMEKQFALAMPKGAEATQLVRDAITCIRATPKLLECERMSVLGSLMTCAQLGLRPGVGVLGHAYLLPFWDGKSRSHKAQLVIGYQGYVELAYRSGKVKSIAARTVYTNDVFEIEYGAAEDRWVHKPCIDGPRGEPRLFYAVGRTVDGGYYLTDPMTVADMERYRDKHATARRKDGVIFGPWVDHFEGMAQKGLALDTPIPTPSGWSSMGTLEVGDRVFDMNGEQTTVTHKSEVKNIGCYRVEFTNGDAITCDEEHRWVAGIGRNAARNGWQVRTIGEMHQAKESGHAVVVPVSDELSIPDVALPVSPWMLGLWLGDGAGSARGDRSAHVSITAHRDVLAELQQRIHTTTPYQVGGVWPDKRSNAVQFGVRGGLAKHLAELGVIGDKHVPDIYLRASARQRLQLLQGLIDSDGSVDGQRGRVRFINTNSRLVDAVEELAVSLGQVVSRSSRRGQGFGKQVESECVEWQPSIIPATLSAKVSRIRPRTVPTYRAVRSIERVESVPTQCIAVDSPTHTYLAGRTMVPTHNTMVRKLMKLMPKSTELVRAIAQDDGVRLNVSPDAVDREPVYVEPEPEPVDVEVEPIPDPPADQVEVELITDAQAKELTTALIKAGYSSVSDRLEWLRSTLFNPDLRDVAELSRVQAVEALAVLSGAAK